MTVDPTPPVPPSPDSSTPANALPTKKPLMSMPAQEQKVIMQFLQMFQQLMQNRPGCGSAANSSGSDS